MPLRSCHAIHKKMGKKPYIAGPPEPLFIVQEPATQVVFGWLLHSQLVMIFPSHSVFLTAGHRDSTIVDKVMKMWPPPAGPDDREPGKDFVQADNSESLNSNQPQKSFRPTDKSNGHGVHPPQQNNTVVISGISQTPGLLILLSWMVLWVSRENTLLQWRKLLLVTAEFTLFWTVL